VPVPRVCIDGQRRRMRGRPGVGPERRSDRGTALPETALVLASVLVMVFGILQVGIIGFMQVMVDGAAFIAAHEYSLYNSSYLQLAQRPFPQLGSVVVDKNTPDAVSVPVNYGTTSSTQRHGGVSLILPSHLQGTAISFSPHSMLSALSGIAVHGSVIEPMNQVSNDAYDAAGAGYGGSSALTTFSTDAMNTPYYYVSQHEMTVCTGGWNTVHVPGLQDPGCLAAYQVRSLGTAEFLDHDNWQRTTLGVGPYAAINRCTRSRSRRTRVSHPGKRSGIARRIPKRTFRPPMSTPAISRPSWAKSIRGTPFHRPARDRRAQKHRMACTR
jgi:hypothetical protein